MRNQKVAKAGTPIKTWTFVYNQYSRNVPRIQEVVGKFASFMASMGINIDPKPKPAAGFPITFGKEPDMNGVFKKMNGLKERPQLVVIVLPEKSTPNYNIVKKVADVDFGVLSICVIENNLIKDNMQYYANVGLKVNLKFGGANHLLREENNLIKAGKTMVVGYDVTHATNLASGSAEGLPSIVGLVASIDKDLAQWPSVSWNNPPATEMLGKELTVNFRSRLKLWQATNKNALPQNIVIFRDGVSEGQFRAVLEIELPLIREACKLTYPNGSQPRISLIISVKRHHTRFYPTDPGHTHPTSKSCKEGTVVDRGVTNVRYWDFFLQAHAALKGKKLLTMTASHPQAPFFSPSILSTLSHLKSVRC